MCNNATTDRVCGAYPVFPEGFIYRGGYCLAPQLPFTANVDNWFSRLACAMKRNDKPGLGQHAPEGWFIKISAWYMQGFPIAFPEKACQLIPRPTTCLDYGSHDFRRAGLDAATMRSDQKAKFDLAIAERDTEVPTKNESTLQNLCVTARLGHENKGSTSTR